MSIADKITRLQTAKSNIASAITTKGGTVSSGDGFEDFATDIASIPSGGTLQSKTLSLGASAPSTVSPDSGYDGLSSVPVTIDSTVIKAENIAQGTTILGITGTHSGGGGATEPYTEETYDLNGNLIGVVMHGHTKIRSNAFANCSYLTSVSLPSGLTDIGYRSFYYCTSLALTSLPSGLTNIHTEAFYSCTSLTLTSLPSGLTVINNGSFRGCSNLALTSLPSGLTSIEQYAFNGCTKLAITSIPSGVTTIGRNAFQFCRGLTSITFEGTPSTISTYVFDSCTNLTTINVPWAEGAVAGAPWGATNATINYNYTGV